jgi:hypothetical protein
MHLAHVVLVNPLDVEAHVDFANNAFFTLAQALA